MFKLNLKIALRNLWKNKGFSLINIGGLAIGLASCMVLLLYVAYEWGYDKQFANFEKTYVVFNNQPTDDAVFTHGWTPAAMADEVRAKINGVKYVSHSTYPNYKLITNKRDGFKKLAVHADETFLKILDYKVIKGNSKHFLDQVNAVVLTESLAKTLFGNEDPINKVLKLDNSEPLIVEGIVADPPKNSSIEFDYLLSWKLYEKLNPWVKTSGWGNNFCLNIVQLKDNANFSQVNAEVKGIFKRNRQDAESEAFLHPLAKWHLYDEFEQGKAVGGKIDQVKIFLLLAICILLIACINFMNLSTARSEKRAKEVGVRKAIGSSRNGLINQFILESILLSLMGMIVAFMLMEISLPYFNNLLAINLTIAYSDWRFWSTLFGLTLLTGIIAGSYPAFYLSSFEPIKVLKGFNIQGTSSLSIRKVLVVFQFVFAACLIICTAVVYQQLNYIKNKPVGYNQANLIELPAQGKFKDHKNREVFKAELIKSGVAANVSYFSMGLTNGGNNTFNVEWPGKRPNSQIIFNWRGADYDLVNTIGSKMIAGREFSPQFTDSNNVVVNEAAVKIMGFKDPIGKVFNLWDEKVTIVGIMKDFVMESAYEKTAPLIIFQARDADIEKILIRIHPSQNISAAMTKIDELAKKINPEYPVERTFVGDTFKKKFKDEQLLGTLSNWFGGFAIFISCLGLLGLALFIAEQRKKEISIRKVLGATTGNILTLLNKDFIKLVAIANVIAFPLAYVIVNKWLSAFEYRVSLSLFPFALAIIISVLIAILTVSIQSIKVAKANPVDALKYE